MEEIINPEESNLDIDEYKLRPSYLKEYIGQDDIKETLGVFIKAAKLRDESLDHVLLYGPPGLGKTTLAYIIANELGRNIKTASGPAIEKTGDLAAILTSLEPGDVLFIDEIHRMPRFIEEVLYSAMEDFTLVGATTRIGDLSSPLRDRFGIINHLNYYTQEDLEKIVKRTAKVYDTKIDNKAASEIAKRSRGTPRLANRLFKRVRDFALVNELEVINEEITKSSLDKLKVDNVGLDELDHKLLRTIIEKYNGGPVGIDALASSIGEEKTTLEDVYEPFLIQNGFLKRTNRGRMATDKAYDHLKIAREERLF